MGQFNDKRLIARGTAPLHKLQRDAVARRTHGNPKRGGRGVTRGGERPDHEEQRLAGLRGQVQAPERLGAHVRLPEEQRTNVPARRICSPAHSASAVFEARTTLTDVSGRPQYAAASGWNR